MIQNISFPAVKQNRDNKQNGTKHCHEPGKSYMSAFPSFCRRCLSVSPVTVLPSRQPEELLSCPAKMEAIMSLICWNWCSEFFGFRQMCVVPFVWLLLWLWSTVLNSVVIPSYNRVYELMYFLCIMCEKCEHTTHQFFFFSLSVTILGTKQPHNFVLYNLILSS